jgi:hypothetical protein
MPDGGCIFPASLLNNADRVVFPEPMFPVIAICISTRILVMDVSLRNYLIILKNNERSNSGKIY